MAVGCEKMRGLFLPVVCFFLYFFISGVLERRSGREGGGRGGRR